MYKLDGTPCCNAFGKEVQHNHCCLRMADCVHDPRIGLKYTPKYRRYYLTIKTSRLIQVIDYCPLCGTKLPENLRDKYDEVLLQEYGIDPDTCDDKDIPEEFKSDEWWKKRGL